MTILEYKQKIADVFRMLQEEHGRVRYIHAENDDSGVFVDMVALEEPPTVKEAVDVSIEF